MLIHSPATAAAPSVPPGLFVMVPNPVVGAVPPGVVQVLFVYLVQVMPVMSGMAFGLLMNLTVPSVNVVVAVPETRAGRDDAVGRDEPVGKS